MTVKVGLYRCPDYDMSAILDALETAFRENPYWGEGITQGTKVFLKLNLLKKNKPEEAVTTHPALVEAVVRLLQSKGAQVTMGDSPGGPYLPSILKGIYRGCGIEQVAERTGACLNYDVSESTVSFLEGKVSKAFQVISPVMQADVVINLPKLKTHQMTKYTGAVKNLFGVIPGLQKVDYHMKMTEARDFCEMLVDLSLCVKPTLHIMDGIVGMEGHGPSAGNPKEVGAVLISTDPFALDIVALALVGIEAETVPTVAAAKARGLIASLEHVTIVGTALEAWKIKPFIAPQISGGTRFPIPEFISQFLRPKPVFQRPICVGCGICVESCPPRALVLEGGYPSLNLEACIRCFCCQELCPHKAVRVKRNVLSRFLGK